MPDTPASLPAPKGLTVPLRRTRHWHRMRRVALAAACLGVASTSRALPEGAVPSFGQTSVSNTGRQMTIVQGTDRAGIDWRSFSVGASEAVRVLQPSASATLFNRVLSTDPSQILGRIDANGRLVLINPNGILFGPGASLNLGSLVASTLSLSDEAMQAGRFDLTRGLRAPGNLSQQGRIDATGTVALVAPQLENTGSITAPRIGLAAAERVKVDLDGSGLVFFNIANDTLDARLRAAGTLTASGGVVDLRAQVRAGVTDTVLNLDGVVMARGVGQRNGRVFIDGGTAGITEVRGTVDASSADAGMRGGEVTLLGDKVGLFGSASLDASGAGGGGTVLVGGNLQGAGPERNANAVYAGPDTRIRADAIQQGGGGLIVLWSDQSTRFEGALSARGGALGGDGGFAEVSSLGVLDFRGDARLGAVLGQAGTLLLDPRDLDIIDDDIDPDVDLNDNVTTGNPFQPTSGGGRSTLTWGAIGGALTGDTNSARVVVSTRNDQSLGNEIGTITVQGTAGATLPGTGTLTLEAAGDLVVDGPLARPDGGALVLRAARNVTVGGQGAVTLGSATTGTIMLSASEGGQRAGSVTITGDVMSGGGVGVQAVNGSLTVNAASSLAAAGNIAVNVSGAITLDDNTTLTAGGGALALQAGGAAALGTATLRKAAGTPLESLVLRADSVTGGGALLPERIGMVGSVMQAYNPPTNATARVAVSGLTDFNLAVVGDLVVSSVNAVEISVADSQSVGPLTQAQGTVSTAPLNVTVDGVSGIDATTVRLQAGGKVSQEAGALITTAGSGGLLLRSGSAASDAIVLNAANVLRGTVALRTANGGGASLASTTDYRVGSLGGALQAEVIGNVAIAEAAGLQGGGAALAALNLSAGANAAVTQDPLAGGAIQAVALTLSGDGSFSLTNNANAADTLTIGAGSGTIAYRNAAGLDVGTITRSADVTLVADTGNLRLTQLANLGTATLRVNAVAGNVTQAADALITAGALGVRAGGSVTLTEANQVDDTTDNNASFGTIAGRAGNGDVRIVNNRDTVVGTVSADTDATLFAAVAGVTATKALVAPSPTNDVTLRVQGTGHDLALAGSLVGDRIRLVAAEGSIAQATGSAGIAASGNFSAKAGAGSLVLASAANTFGAAVAGEASVDVGLRAQGNLTVGPAVPGDSVQAGGAALAGDLEGISAGTGRSVALVSTGAMALDNPASAVNAGRIGLQAGTLTENTTLTAGTVIRRGDGGEVRAVAGHVVAADAGVGEFNAQGTSIEVGNIAAITAGPVALGPLSLLGDTAVPVAGVSGIRAGTVRLRATGGDITQSAPVLATTLAARASGDIVLGADNAAATLALQSGGNLLFREAAGGYTIGQVAGLSSAQVDIATTTGIVATGRAELFTTGGTVSQDAALAQPNAQVGVRAGGVLLDGPARYQLSLPGNSTTTLAVASAGNGDQAVSFLNEGALRLAPVDRVGTGVALTGAVRRGADVSLRAAAGDLSLDGSIDLRSVDTPAGTRFTLRLQAPAGSITQAQPITAVAVSAQASGAVNLTDTANDLGDDAPANTSFGTVAGRAGNGDFRVVNTRDTRVAAVSADAADVARFPAQTGVQATSQITLRVTGSGNDLAIEQPVNAGSTGTVRLESAGGSITMAANPAAPSTDGVITAASLAARAAGSVTLTAANVIDDADAANAVFGTLAGSAGNGAFRVVNTRDTSVGQVAADPANAQLFAPADGVAASGADAAVTLRVTGTGHDLALDRAVLATAAGTVRLSVEAGDITQTAPLLARAVGAQAGGNVSLTATNNEVDDANASNGTFGTIAGRADNGSFRFVNARDTVVSAVDDDPVDGSLFAAVAGVSASRTAPTAVNDITLRVTGAGSDLALAAPVAGGTVRLGALGGSVLQAFTGAGITVDTGLGVFAGGGSVVLAGAGNSAGGAVLTPTVGASAVGGDLGIRFNGDLMIGSVAPDGALFDGLGVTSATGNLALVTDGRLTINSSLSAERLGLEASTVVETAAVTASAVLRRSGGAALAVEGKTVAAQYGSADFDWQPPAGQTSIEVGSVAGFRVGPASAGPVTTTSILIDSLSGIQAGTVRLDAPAGEITQTAAVIATQALGARARGDIRLGGNNLVGLSGQPGSGTVALQSGGDILFRESGDGYTVGRVVTAGLNPATFAAGIVSTAAAGRVELNTAGGEVSQDQTTAPATADVSLRANSLLLRGDADYTLTRETNNVALVAAGPGGGTLRYTDANGLRVDTVRSVGGTAPGADVVGITRSGDVALRTVDGNLTLAQGIDVSGAVGKRIELQLSGVDTSATQVAGKVLRAGADGALLLRGEGSFALTDAGNDVGTLAAGTGVGALRYADANALSVGTVTPVGGTAPADDVVGITRSGEVALRTVDGGLSVAQPISLGAALLRLQAAGAEGDVRGGGTVSAGALGVVAARDIVLSSADNDAGRVAMRSGGDLAYAARDTYRIGAVDADSTLVTSPPSGAPVVFDGADGLRANTTSGTVQLRTPVGEVTQDSAIRAARLLLQGGAAYTLTSEGNDIGSLAASAGAGTLRYTDANGLRVDTVRSVGGSSPADDVVGITRSGDVALRTVDGNLTLAQGIDVSAVAGRSVELVVSKAGTSLRQDPGRLLLAGASGALVLGGDGDVTLANAGNDVGSLSIASGTGAVAYADRDTLTVKALAADRVPSGTTLDAAITHAGPVHLRAGAQQAADLVIDGMVTMPTATLGLQASRDLRQDAGVIDTGATGVHAGANVLLGSLNRIGVVGVSAGSGSVLLRQAGSYRIDAVTASGTTMSGAPVDGVPLFQGVDGVSALQGTVELITRSGAVTQASAVSASNLALRGGAGYTLTQAGNAVQKLASDAAAQGGDAQAEGGKQGTVVLVSTGSLALDGGFSLPSGIALQPDSAIDREGDVWVRALAGATPGDITLVDRLTLSRQVNGANAAVLGLQAAGRLTQSTDSASSGAISTGTLAVRSQAGDVLLQAQANAVHSFTAQAPQGDVLLRETDGYRLLARGASPDLVAGGAAAGRAVFEPTTQAVHAGKILALQTAGGEVAQEGDAGLSALKADQLLLSGASTYSLRSTANQAKSLAFRLDAPTPGTSALHFFNQGDLRLAPVDEAGALGTGNYVGFSAPVNAIVRATGTVTFDGEFVANSTAPTAAPARFRVISQKDPTAIAQAELQSLELDRYLVSQAAPTGLIKPDGTPTPIADAATVVQVQDAVIRQAGGSKVTLAGGVTLDLEATHGGSIALANQGNDFGGADFRAGAIVARSAQARQADASGVLDAEQMAASFSPKVSLAGAVNNAYILSRVQLAASNIVLGQSSGGLFTIDEYDGKPGTSRTDLQAGVEADLVRLSGQRISTAGVAQNERNFIIGRYFAQRSTNFELQLPGLVLSLQPPEGASSTVPRFGAVSNAGQAAASGADLQAAAEGNGPGLNVAVGVPSRVGSTLPQQAGWILIDPNTRKSPQELADLVNAYRSLGGVRISLNSPVERDDQGLLLAVGKDFLGASIPVLTNLVDSTSVAAASAIRGVAELQEKIRRDQIERSVTSESVARDLREVVIVETRMSPPATTGTQGLRPPAGCQPGAGRLGCGPTSQ